MSVLDRVALAEALRLFRVDVPAVECWRRGRSLGRYFRLERHRDLLACELSTGAVLACRDEAHALATLGAHDVLERGTVEVLAVCVAPPPRPPGDFAQPMPVAYVFDAGFGAYATVDLGGRIDVRPSEAEALLSVLPEALWRAGATALPTRVPTGIDDVLVALLRDA